MLFLSIVLITIMKTELARLRMSHKFQLFLLLQLSLPELYFLTIEVRHDEISKGRPISLIFAKHILMNIFEVPILLFILLPLPCRSKFSQHIFHC